ncbi:hypothetical protein Vretimale_10694, partial [Volvox reticuliferus]
LCLLPRSGSGAGSVTTHALAALTAISEPMAGGTATTTLLGGGAATSAATDVTLWFEPPLATAGGDKEISEENEPEPAAVAKVGAATVNAAAGGTAAGAGG